MHGGLVGPDMVREPTRPAVPARIVPDPAGGRIAMPIPTPGAADRQRQDRRVYFQTTPLGETMSNAIRTPTDGGYVEFDGHKFDRAGWSPRDIPLLWMAAVARSGNDRAGFLLEQFEVLIYSADGKQYWPIKSPPRAATYIPEGSHVRVRPDGTAEPIRFANITPG